MVGKRKRDDDAVPRIRRVLSLDGGGMRGVVSLEFLKVIRSALRQEMNDESLQLCDVFDLIVGTSTGGLLAVMIGILRLDLEEIERLYKELGKNIFNTSIWRMVQQGARYDLSKLKEEIQKILRAGGLDAESSFRDLSEDRSCCRVALVSTCISTCEEDSAEPTSFIFRSYDCLYPMLRQKGTSYSSPKQPRIWQAMCATAAAPYYFVSVPWRDYLLQDGGLVANNPTKVALDEVLLGFGQNPTSLDLVVSVGTGDAPHSVPSSTTPLGKVQNLIHELVTICTGTKKTHEYVENDFRAIESTTPGRRYFRFQIDLEKDVDLAETDLDKLSAICDLASQKFSPAGTSTEDVMVESIAKIVAPTLGKSPHCGDRSEIGVTTGEAGDPSDSSKRTLAIAIRLLRETNRESLPVGLLWTTRCSEGLKARQRFFDALEQSNESLIAFVGRSKLKPTDPLMMILAKILGDSSEELLRRAPATIRLSLFERFHEIEYKELVSLNADVDELCRLNWMRVTVEQDGRYFSLSPERDADIDAIDAIVSENYSIDRREIFSVLRQLVCTVCDRKMSLDAFRWACYAVEALTWDEEDDDDEGESKQFSVLRFVTEICRGRVLYQLRRIDELAILYNKLALALDRSNCSDVDKKALSFELLRLRVEELEPSENLSELVCALLQAPDFPARIQRIELYDVICTLGWKQLHFMQDGFLDTYKSAGEVLKTAVADTDVFPHLKFRSRMARALLAAKQPAEAKEMLKGVFEGLEEVKDATVNVERHRGATKDLVAHIALFEYDRASKPDDMLRTAWREIKQASMYKGFSSADDADVKIVNNDMIDTMVTRCRVAILCRRFLPNVDGPGEVIDSSEVIQNNLHRCLELLGRPHTRQDSYVCRTCTQLAAFYAFLSDESTDAIEDARKYATMAKDLLLLEFPSERERCRSMLAEVEGKLRPRTD